MGCRRDGTVVEKRTFRRSSLVCHGFPEGSAVRSLGADHTYSPRSTARPSRRQQSLRPRRELEALRLEKPGARGFS